jgi:hypothetical protein
MTKRTKLLLPVLAVIVLALTFGKAIGQGYYFGGCDETAHTRHFITHVLGFKMCRDEEIETEAVAAPAESQANTPTESQPAPSEAEAAGASICVLYVRNHNAKLEITGPEAVTDCGRFERASTAPWTSEAHSPTSAGVTVCEVTNLAREHATVTDTGAQEYGSSACKQLSGEGWG